MSLAGAGRYQVRGGLKMFNKKYHCVRARAINYDMKAMFSRVMSVSIDVEVVTELALAREVDGSKDSSHSFIRKEGQPVVRPPIFNSQFF